LLFPVCSGIAGFGPLPWLSRFRSFEAEAGTVRKTCSCASCGGACPLLSYMRNSNSITCLATLLKSRFAFARGKVLWLVNNGCGVVVHPSKWLTHLRFRALAHLQPR